MTITAGSSLPTRAFSLDMGNIRTYLLAIRKPSFFPSSIEFLNIL
jgi:hypothetical protein